MNDFEQLRHIFEELLEILHTEAKELEKLMERVEQFTGHLGYQQQFSVVASMLPERLLRVQKLAPVAIVPIAVDATANEIGD